MSNGQAMGMGGGSLPPPRNAQEEQSGADVMFQAAIGWGRAGMAILQNPDDAQAMQEFVGFKRIMSQIGDAMVRAAGQGAAAQGPQRMEPQTGISPQAPDLPARPRNFQA
jgi:hypothetical protein